MTPEQKFERWERLLRSICERPLPPKGESRKQTDRLGDYVLALEECDLAREALAAQPDDPETKENMRRAEEVLDRAREELKRSTAEKRRHLPA